MKLIVLTIVLACVGGCLSMNSECMNIFKEKKCPKITRQRFPMTKEEYNQICSLFSSHLNCVSEVYDECEKNENNEKEARFHNQVKTFIEERFCNENNELYEVVSRNLRCIRDNYWGMMDKCDRDALLEKDETNVRVLEDLILQYVSGGPDSEALDLCLEGFLTAACGSITYSELCGEEVGKAYLTTMLQTGHRISQCPAEATKEMPAVIEALKTIVKVSDDIRKRK